MNSSAVGAHNYITWSSIEVVITRRTRNPLALRGPWVRIPPAPPKAKHLARCFFISQADFYSVIQADGFNDTLGASPLKEKPRKLISQIPAAGRASSSIHGFCPIHTDLSPPCFRDALFIDMNFIHQPMENHLQSIDFPCQNHFPIIFLP